MIKNDGEKMKYNERNANIKSKSDVEDMLIDEEQELNKKL